MAGQGSTGQDRALDRAGQVKSDQVRVRPGKTGQVRLNQDRLSQGELR